MADEVQGLSAEITGDATPLLRALERAEAALRSFDQRWGKTTIQIAANIQQAAGAAGATVPGGVTHELIAALRAPAGSPGGAGGRFVNPAQAASLTPQLDQALRTHDAQLALAVNAASTTARASVREAVEATGVIGRPTISVPVASEAASGPVLVQRSRGPGSPDVYRDPSGALRRVFPAGGGAVGGSGIETVGGFALPPGARGFTGGNPRAEEEAAVFRAENERLRAQVQAAAAQRQAAGAASYQQAVAEGRVDPATGRILSRAAVAGPTIQRAPVVAPVAAAAPPIGPAGDIDRFVAKLASQGLSKEEQAQVLDNLGKGDVARELRRSASQITAASAAASAPTRGRVRISPEQRSGLLEDPARALAEEQIAAAREEVIAAPTRPTSPRVAAARLVGGLFGLPQQEILQRRVTQAANEYQSAITRQDEAQLKLNEAQKSGVGDVEGLTKALAKSKDESLQYSSALNLARNAAIEGSGGAKTFASSFIGGVAGGLAFGTAMQVVSGAIGLVDKALGPVIERFTGYQNLAGRLTNTLSDQTRQASGQVEIILAQSAAQANLNATTAAAIQPILAQRTATEAGNKAISDQFDLVNSALAIRRQNQQFGGQDRGLFQTTGGLNIFGLQTPFFGTPSTQELLGRQLGQPAQSAGLNLVGQLPGLVGGLVSNPLNPGAAANSFLQSVAKPIEQAVTDTKANMDYFNEQLKKGGENTLRFTEGVGAGAKAQAEAQAKLLDRAGAPDLAKALRDQGGNVLIQGLTNANQVQQLLQAFNAGAQRPDLGLVLAQQAPAIAAQRALFRAQADTQRNQLIPAAFGLQTLAQPITAFGTGFTSQQPSVLGGGRLQVPAGLQGAFGGGGGAFAASFGRFAPVLQGVDQQLVQLQKDGRAALEAMVPQDQIGQFRALETQIGDVGQKIAGIQAGISQEQANLQIAQYSEQLRVATRSRTDLLQLTRQEGAAQGDNLGLLERQSIELGRQSDQLSLQLNTLQLQLRQRQVNLQVALAGFTAPGITPEERAARIEEAKREAEFAQKQLDIQKQQLGIQKQQLPISFRIQDIGFVRQLTDITHQIALINQGIRVTADTAAADQAVAHLSALQDQLVKKAQTYVDETAKAVAAYQQGAAGVAAQTGAAFSDVLTQSAKAWNIFTEQARIAYMGITGQFGGGLLGGTGPGYGGNLNPGSGPHQTGYLGRVNRPTTATFGEAGGEMVAILRNPHEGMFGAGGGGNHIILNVTVTGNTVRNDEDLQRLSDLVARKVEEKMSRQSSLLGFRP